MRHISQTHEVILSDNGTLVRLHVFLRLLSQDTFFVRKIFHEDMYLSKERKK